MPDENPILIYWRSELQVFNKNLLSLQQQINEEATHDLRVAIKKLRSCFKIYSDLIEKKHKKELPAGFDSLFSILGKQRDIEMNKKLLFFLISFYFFALPLYSQKKDTLSRQLQERGVLNQKQDVVPEGIRLTCYVSRNGGAGLRVYEASASDYTAAAQAILKQLDTPQP